MKYVDNQLTETINKCVVFILAYVHLIGRSELELSDLAEGIFDDSRYKQPIRIVQTVENNNPLILLTMPIL